MGNEAESRPDARHLLTRTNLYREFQAEKDEIMRYKWLESEKAGYDIGFERALVEWITQHRAAWRRSRQANLNPGSSSNPNPTLMAA